jgi:hypothetical protein
MKMNVMIVSQNKKHESLLGRIKDKYRFGKDRFLKNFDNETGTLKLLDEVFFIDTEFGERVSNGLIEIRSFIVREIEPLKFVLEFDIKSFKSDSIKTSYVCDRKTNRTY